MRSECRGYSWGLLSTNLGHPERKELLIPLLPVLHFVLCDEAVVVGVEPIEHLRAAFPFILGNLAVVIRIQFAHVKPSAAGELVARDVTIMVGVQLIEHFSGALPLVAGDLPVTVGVHTLVFLRRQGQSDRKR